MKKISTLFASFLAATSLFAEADIYEIRPFKRNTSSSVLHEYVPSVNAFGQNNPYADKSAPLDSGELYFNVRLVTRRTADDAMEAGSFRLDHPGAGEAVDWVVRPPKIGISVGGRPDYATMVLPPTRMPYNYDDSSKGNTEYLYDMVFKYTIKPGDIGLPIVLTDSAGKPLEPGSSSSTVVYNLINVGSGSPWEINYYNEGGTASAAAFSITTDRQEEQFKQITRAGYSGETEKDFLTSNDSLKQCGFYVQAVDFDRDETRSPGWKTVRENRTSQGCVEIIDGEVFATNMIPESTLYVWAVSPDWLADEKPSVAKWDATPAVQLVGETATVTIGYDGDTPVTREVQMATVKMKAGALYANFSFTGTKDAAGKTATLILSSSRSKDFSYLRGSGDLLNRDFVTCDVECVEGQPELMLKLTESTDIYTVTGDYTNTLTRMALTLTDAYTEEINVTITPSLKKSDGWDVYDVIRLSETADRRTGWKTTGPLTVTIPKGSTSSLPVFIYGMGASADENLWTDGFGNEVDFTLTPDKGTEFIKKMPTDALYVVPAAPEITNASKLESMAVSGGDVIPVVVSDNYTDINDTTTGYQIFAMWWNDGEEPPTDPKFKKEAFTLKTADDTIATFKPDSKGTLTALDGGVMVADELPALPSEVRGDHLRLRITAPNTAKTAFVDMTVAKKPKAFAYAYASKSGTEKPDSFQEITDEGEATRAYIGVNLETANKSSVDLYAFLKLKDEKYKDFVSGRCIVTDGSAEKGICIPTDEFVEADRGRVELKLLDGIEDGTILRFEVVLCTTEPYDSTKVYSKYDVTTPLEIIVDNVKPTIKNISMSDWNLLPDSTEFEGDATKGIDQYFKFDIKDAARDLGATGDDAFKITCQFKGCSPKYTKSMSYYGDPADLIVTNKFNATGKCTLSVTVEDKDGGKTGPLSYTFDVVDKPYITIANKDEVKSFYEDETPEFWVTLSDNSSDEDDLEVELTVTPQVTGDKKGALTVDGDFTLKAGTTDTYVCTYAPGVTEHSFTVKSADGTAGNVSKFTFKAKVTTTSYVPETETPWSDYFTAGVLSSVQVKNAKPSVTVDGRVCRATRTDAGESDDIIYLNSSNAPISVAIGEADKISWSVDDVEADLTKGISVTIVDQYGPDTKTYTTTDTQTFTPQFKYAGTTTVTLTATDKDGGSITVTRFYLVKSTRQLNITAVGPSENGNSSKHASYYRGAGRGQGHVYADAKCTGASNFSLDFNCGLANFVKASAQGYRKGDIDDGSLTKNGSLGDVPITPEGKLWTAGGAYFAYDGDYDSFFYCWLKDTYDNGVMTSAIFVAPSPEVSKAANISIDLPTEKDDEDSYAQTTFEVIFSKEYLTTDNVGDINNDGIPDIYALGYEGFGVSGEEMTDMKNLREYNDDGDYFPFVFDNVQSSFIFMPSNNWVSNTRKFTAYREIRGWGDHFNDAYQVLAAQGYAGSIPEFTADTDDRKATYSPLEYDAWVQAGKDPNWSPERPTDPTNVDTDGDEMPDGYEYYIWYKAHVGWFDGDGNHQYITGHKYNHLDPTASTFLTSDAIASAFDPLTNSGSDWDTHDMDNDGLTDYQEYLLGTCPWEWDTDNDLLPDGYEVIVTGTDPRVYDTNDSISQRHADGTGENPDGDAMASFNMPVGLIGVLDGDEVKCYCLNKGTFTPAVFEEGGVATHTRVGTVFTAVSGTTSNLYVTAGALSTYADEDGKTRLMQHITKNLWHISAEDGRLVLGDSATLERNMEVTDILADQEYFYKEIFQLDQVSFEPTSAKTIYATWKYRVDGVYALGKVAGYDFMNKPVVFYNNDATVRVMHDDVLKIRTAEAAKKPIPLPSGYNPTTAWQSGGADSAEYVNHDEFMSMFYLYHKGVWSAADITPTVNNPFTRIWTRCPTSAVSADTEGDQIPDGWELYVGEGKSAITHESGSNANVDADGDWLTLYEEYSGIDSSGYYGWSPKYPAWRNKKWPTDPKNADTDDDGLIDGQEGGCVTDPGSKYYYLSDIVGTYFKYNGDDARPNVRGLRICWAGGMLNPCWCDTDLDGLPDEWEAEFHGSYIANTTGTINTNVGGTNTQSIVVGHRSQWNMDGMDGTVEDSRLDYDGDGLANWQEYLVGAMRCWRYDDAVSPWESGYATVTNMPSPGTAAWNKYWHDLLLDSSPTNSLYNPHMANGYCDPGRYLTRCPYNWADGNYSPYGSWYYFKDGAHHELADFPNPNYQRAREEWPDGNYPYEIVLSSAPQKYISCDPRLIDSDHDGMDDYYELFHGMNPLLGAANVADATDASGMPNDYNTPCDLVFDAYVHRAGSNPGATTGGTSAYPACARNNFWTNTKYREAKIKNPELGGYDFMAYPWMNGLASADADGDGIVNIEEAIMPNVQAASTYHHTDPTPLWTTDSSYTNSLTRRFYRLGLASAQNEDGLEYTTSWTKFTTAHTFEWEGETYDLADFDGFTYNGGMLTFRYAPNHWGTADDWAFSFEENEGYDSDHDYLSDMEELQGKTKNASDPQVHDDPLRRQAMYFNGEDAFLQTPVRVREVMPVELFNPDQARQNFLYFTVECWVKADASILAEQATYTMVERAIYADNAGPADEKLIRKNFQIAVKNGRWYACYDSTGTTAKKYEITNGPVATTDWTLVTATFDGEEFKLYVNGVCNNLVATQAQPEHGISALAVTPYNAMTTNGYGTVWHDQDYVTILVGASVKTKRGFIFDNAWRCRNFSLITPDNPYGIDWDNKTTFADYQDFFKGYIDEVRIWDGARSAADIQGDYDSRTRYTLDLAAENRLAVYTKWAAGCSRAPTSSEQLPALLMYHWAFDHIPGAVEAGDVVPVPAGFDTAKSVTDASAQWVRPDGFKSPHWDSVGVRSTVYGQTAWVPWLNNTVAHLPRLDRTTLDSVYWSDDYIGYSAVVTNATMASYNVTQISFPRKAEVPSVWHQQTYSVVEYYDSHRDPYFDWWNGFTTKIDLMEGATQNTRWHAIAGYDPTYTVTDDTSRFSFTSRDRNVVGDDLLPMGGAYPRRISLAEGGMWDNQPGQSPSASDAWAQTGNDADNNGLPDWWEEYARANYCETLDPKEPLEWDTTVTYRNGMAMPAYEAYLRDLASGLVKIGSSIVRDENYADTRDADKDGMADWWEEMNGLSTALDDSEGDRDNDGLTNYREYLLSEVDNKGYVDSFSPISRFSVNNQFDYFRTNGLAAPAKRYAGFDMTDHDFIEDYIEDGRGLVLANKNVYDAHQDYDCNGWSLWSEARAMNNSATWIQVGTETNLVDHTFYGEWRKRDNGDDYLALTPEHKAWLVTNKSDVVMTTYIAANGITGPGGNDPVTEFSGWVWDASGYYVGSGYTSYLGHEVDADKMVGITYTTYDIVPITAYSGTPLPNVTLSVWGQVAALTNGTNVVASGDLTLKCYKGYDYDKQYFDMSAAYQTFNLTGGEELNGKTVYEFNGEGLKEGLNLFVVENGDFSGYAVANVGFDKVILNVGIDNPNAVFSASITSRVDSVAIMRTEINGVSCTERIVWSGAVDGRITPAAILKNGAASGLDLDAQYLVSDAAQIGIVNKDIGSATYQLLLSNDTGSWLGESFVKQFSADRPQGRPVGPTKNNEYTVRTRKPVFKFSGLEGATACIIEVADKEDGNVLGTVTNALPTADANGVRALTTEIQIGDNVTLADGSNYVWRICGLNAKWIDAGGWSDWQSFETAIDSSRKLTGYGKLSAEIRYYGSATNDTSDVIVGVYEDAAFACDPVATVRLEAGSFDRLSIVCDSGKYFSAEAQVTVDGLPPGDYYVMAFNDRNKNGKRDPWETWGYLNMVGDSSGDPNLYTPTVYTVESTTVPNSPCCVFMEDTDVNDDYLPDCIQEESVLSSAVINTVDSDGDGLSDVIEKCIGTNPQLPDTDGDGIPDGYDKAYLSPLYNNADDEVASGDVMAFAKITGTFIMLEDGIYMLAEDQRVPNVGDSAKGLNVRTTYTYPVWEDGVIVEYLGVGTNLTLTTEAKIQTVSEGGTAVIVHAQVYDEFGYDPTTATTDENAANTKEFTALDKFLVVRYLEAIGLADEATVNKRGLWEQYTLKPYDTDNDGDGIADGWELYVMFGPDGAGSETLADAKISPWKYDDARAASPDSAGTANEITLLDEYDGGNAPTDPWNVDTDGDGVSDYYASKYHLKGGDSGADYDGDGLSNYAEYLISEVFKFAALDPDNAKTDGSCVDYFRKYGDLYFGEIFTDHDQVSDVWEQKYAHKVGSSSDLYANRDIYDPSADRDSDGWSNYAEAKAGTSPENITSPGVDGETLKEYPVPAIRAKVVYRGKSVLSAPLIFQAWSEKTDPGMTSVPDAAWRTATDEAETNVTKYIGLNPGTVRNYYLGTGAVSPGSVRINFRDMSYERATVFNGEELVGKTVSGEVGAAKWFYFVQDRDGVLYTSATNLTASTPVKVGTIDYATGYMTVDFGCDALQGAAYDFSINGDTSTTADAKATAVYSNCDKLNLANSYVKIEWLPVKTDTTGNATYYLSDCTANVQNKGHVCEGKSKFVVFSDTDEDGAYTPGEPFGFVGGVEVGWQGGAFEVELTETSPIFARVDLTSTSDPTTDRVAFQAGNSAVIDVDDAQKLFKSDTKLRVYGEDSGYGDSSSESESSTSSGSESRYVRVRVVRALVDGSDVLGKDWQGHNVYVDRAVVMDKYLDLGVRGYIHEGDFLSTNSFDVGWSDLQENVYGRDEDLARYVDATNITYMIVMGEGSYTAGGSNTVFRSLISRKYDSITARLGGFVKPVIDAKQPGYVYGAKPTFRWAMQDKNGISHNSYTAFKLQILNGSNAVYDSGYRCAPACGADGWYEWTLADPLGSVIEPGEEYTWRVAMFNAKFRDDTFWVSKAGSTVTTWSDSGAFVVDMNQQQEMNDHGYSTIAATVKYTGPECVLTKGAVIVQAFETADFAGDPMGEAFVTDDDEIADTAHVVANARILGLPATGTYYLRAFIDSNGNGVKDDWESWGAASESVTISTTDVTCPTAGIYIEDADTDGDWIPDAYEYVKKGNLTAFGPEVIDGDKIRFIGTIATTVDTAGISTGLTGASLTIFQNQSFVKLAMADLGATVSIDDIRKAVEKKINPDTVKITALTLSPDGSKVTLALAAEVTDSIAGSLLGKVYDISNLTKQTVTVTVKVYKKNTLAEAGWTLVSTQSKTFGRDAQQIDVPVSGVNMTSGFYKVEVVQ